MLKIISKEKTTRVKRDAYNRTATIISLNTFITQAHLISSDEKHGAIV